MLERPFADVQDSAHVPVVQQVGDFGFRAKLFSHTKSQLFDALFQFLPSRGVDVGKSHINIVLIVIFTSFGANVRRRNPCSQLRWKQGKQQEVWGKCTSTNRLFHPIFPKCVLVALIWYEVALLPMKTDAHFSSEEKGCRLWQSDEVAFRVVLLSVRSFWAFSSQFLLLVSSILGAFLCTSKQQTH